MFKRIVQFISVLSLSILLIGGVLYSYAGLSKSQPFPKHVGQHPNIINEKPTENADVDLQWEKGKQKQQHNDDRAIEKPEESDVKPSSNKDNPSFPLLADLLHKNIAFSLFSLLYNKKSSSTYPDILITCYDSKKIIFLQHFRI